MSIYLDNAATTKPLRDILNHAEEYFEDGWYNPSARYAPATVESGNLDKVRASVLKLFSGEDFEVLFTASGTESANTVIMGGARKKSSMHFITDAAEHPAVYEAMMAVKDRGADVTVVPTDMHGRVNADDVLAAIKEDTALVSIMHVNNETGAVNDIEKIAAAVKAKNKNILFHSDGVQAYGRVFLKDTSSIDYYTASAHKIHALKGTGIIFYRKGSPLKPLIAGGGQEKGLRSGTENTFGIKALGIAAEYFNKNRMSIKEQLTCLKGSFLKAVMEETDAELISPEDGADHIVSLSLKSVRGEVLLHALETDGIYISQGSACSSKKGVSRTAKSLGLSREKADGIIRVSFSPFNTEEEVIKAAGRIAEHAEVLSAFTRK